MRALLWRLLWGTAFRIWSPGFRTSGSIPGGPVIFAANHASHADTAAIQLTLARAGHTRVLAAGAEDYFFRNRIFGFFSRVIGVFPFPRSGPVGISRAREILARGRSVLLFPQGTRNGGPFRCGVAHIAGTTYAVVPVTIRGTARMLPKGTHRPRRTKVSVVFGTALRRGPGEPAAAFATRLEKAVLGVEDRALAA